MDAICSVIVLTRFSEIPTDLELQAAGRTIRQVVDLPVTKAPVGASIKISTINPRDVQILASVADVRGSASPGFLEKKPLRTPSGLRFE